MKIILNKRHGGFGLSKKAFNMYKEKTGKELECQYDLWCRYDEQIVEIVETLGKDANDEYASLHIVEIPDEAFWEISDYDGYETLIWSMSEINYA